MDHINRRTVLLVQGWDFVMRKERSYFVLVVTVWGALKQKLKHARRGYEPLCLSFWVLSI
jgi:hypothetical protein